MARTMVLLSRALTPIGTIRASKYVRLKKTLLAFADPPLAQAEQEDLRCTDPANPTTRSTGIGVDATCYGVDVHEHFLFDERRKLAGLILNMLYDLGIDATIFNLVQRSSF